MCLRPSNKSSFIHISLSLLSSLCSLTLYALSVPDRMHICAAHLCLFSCLCAKHLHSKCKQQGRPKCAVLSYISDAAWHIKHLSHSHLGALPITYLQCALSYEYPLWQTELKSVTLQQRRGIQQIFFCHTVLLDLTSSVHHHTFFCPKSTPLHLNEHSFAPCVLPYVSQWWAAIPLQCTIQHSFHK